MSPQVYPAVSQSVVESQIKARHVVRACLVLKGSIEAFRVGLEFSFGDIPKSHFLSHAIFSWTFANDVIAVKENK